MAKSWKTVRIFISSTFRDMHAERDYLVKVVFPELREFCMKRQLNLVDIDLRWGVTEEEAEQGKVLESIFEQIERSRPFFIGILGERYGSVPDNIPKYTTHAYAWLENYIDYSFTALEITYGVLSNPELSKRSYFYFRNPLFISKVPENLRSNFTVESPEAASKIATLKDKIRSSGRPVMENYPCVWDYTKKSILGLELFGQQVLRDLCTAISEEYPEDTLESDPLTIERQMHEAFVEERSNLYCGRVEEIALLTHYVQDIDSRLIVITGESGSGKSSFLSSWYRRYVLDHPEDYILAYFIGASPDSTDQIRLLRTMCKELKNYFDLSENIPEDDAKLSEVLASLLQSASQRKRIVILLDALNQLSAKKGANGLSWLLNYLPTNVHVVVSSLEGDSLDVLRCRNPKEITLQPLTRDEQQQIVQAQLTEWGRKLDEKQVSALLSHPGVKKPLYLRVALEELRLFGSNEQLTERIKTLAPDVSSLFDQVLERLEEDHGRDFVKEVFSLLGCSRYGLNENELLELLRRKEEEQFPRALWVRLFRSAKAYLIERSELIGFFHSQLSDAVTTRYLLNENRHSKLAAYFSQVPFERKVDEYPYQLQHAEKWESLAVSLSNLDFFEYAWDKGKKYEWMAYWESLKERYDPKECYQKVIDKRLNNTGETVNIARSMKKVGELFSGMSIYTPALSMFQKSLSILNLAVGSDNPETAALFYNIAQAYDKQCGKSKAELVIQYYNDAYEKYIKLGEPLEASQAKIELANFKRRALKKLKEAKIDCEEAGKTLNSISEKSYSSYNLLYARYLNILGLIYSGLGDPKLVKECQNLFQQSIIYKKEVGDIDSIGESENSFGLFLRNTANKNPNKINEAIDHLNKALEIRNSIGNYRGAAQSCRNLGMCYTDKIFHIRNSKENEENYQLAKQSYLNGINYWNQRKEKPPIEELLEFKYRLGELEINYGSKKEGIIILEKLQEERNRIGDWHNRARALDLLLKAYNGTNEAKITANKIINIYENVLVDETKLKQLDEEPIKFKNAIDILERIIKEVPEYERITSKILEDISIKFSDRI